MQGGVQGGIWGGVNGQPKRAGFGQTTVENIAKSDSGIETPQGHCGVRSKLHRRVTTEARKRRSARSMAGAGFMVDRLKAVTARVTFGIRRSKSGCRNYNALQSNRQRLPRQPTIRAMFARLCCRPFNGSISSIARLSYHKLPLLRQARCIQLVTLSLVSRTTFETERELL